MLVHNGFQHGTTYIVVGNANRFLIAQLQEEADGVLHRMIGLSPITSKESRVREADNFHQALE